MIDWLGDVIVSVLEVGGAAGEEFHPRRRRLTPPQRRRRVQVWSALLVLAIGGVIASLLFPAWPAATLLFGGAVAIGVVSLAVVLELRRSAVRDEAAAREP